MERVILDVDTGLDDAVALLLAAGLEEIQIEGIIATNGNVEVAKTLENTLNIAEVASLTCPVFKGADKPFSREPIAAGDFHGESGLDGPVFAPRMRQQVQSENGIDALIRMLNENPGQISVVSVGPLTDLALAIQKQQDILSLAKQVVIMGGSFSGGNVTSEAEFNTYGDPEAAQIVFSSKANLVLFPLDCTHQVTLSPEQLAGYGKINRECAKVFTACMKTYAEKYSNHGKGWPQLHDPQCIAYLIDPEKVTTRYERVQVVTEQGPTYGKTIASATEEKDGVHVAYGIDSAWFWTLVDRALSVLP